MANGNSKSNSSQQLPRRRSATDGDLLIGYREMANDQAQEAEALEWCEGLVGDAMPQEG